MNRGAGRPGPRPGLNLTGAQAINPAGAIPRHAPHDLNAKMDKALTELGAISLAQTQILQALRSLDARVSAIERALPYISTSNTQGAFQTRGPLALD